MPEGIMLIGIILVGIILAAGMPAGKPLLVLSAIIGNIIGRAPGDDSATNGNTNAEIYQRGGRIAPRDLRALVKRLGYDGRAIGALHGRRLAAQASPLRIPSSILSAKRSTSSSVVYTLGVTRSPWNSGWINGVVTMRCLAISQPCSLPMSIPSIA